MKYANEVTGSRGKGVFIANLEYKRKSHLPAAVLTLKKALRDTLKGQIAAIKTAGSITLMNDIANTNLTSANLKKAVTEIYTTVGSDFAKATYKNLRGEQKSDLTNAETIWRNNMANYVEQNTAERIKIITNTTEKEFKRVVKNVTQTAQENGWSIEKTAAEIQRQIGFNNTMRARRIAQTEVISASNKGSLEGAQATGLKLDKQWLATKTGNTRHSHKQADGQIATLTGKFRLEKFDSQGNSEGWEEIEHAGDPNGSAGNVINCRCTQVYVRKLGN